MIAEINAKTASQESAAIARSSRAVVMSASSLSGQDDRASRVAKGSPGQVCMRSLARVIGEGARACGANMGSSRRAVMSGSAPTPGLDKQGPVLLLPSEYCPIYGKDLVNAVGRLAVYPHAAGSLSGETVTARDGYPRRGGERSGQLGRPTLRHQTSEQCSVFVKSKVWQSKGGLYREPPDFAVLVSNKNRLAALPVRNRVNMIGRWIAFRCFRVGKRNQESETGWSNADFLPDFSD